MDVRSELWEAMSRMKNERRVGVLECGIVKPLILLFDIGNTNTHLGLANQKRVLKQANIPTSAWFDGTAMAAVVKFIAKNRLIAAATCSVVPRATPLVHKAVREVWKVHSLELTPKSLRGVGIDYPKPATIGPDRFANAVAVRHHFGAPSVVSAVSWPVAASQNRNEKSPPLV